MWSPLIIFEENLSINSTFLIIPGGFGPFVAGLLLTRLVYGSGSVQSWVKTIFSIKIRYTWYLLALTLPLIVGIISIIFFSILNQASIDFSLASPFFAYPIFLVFIFFLGGGQEEPGWRGFALPHLLKKFSPFITSVFIGIMWTFWHTPLFFVAESAQHNLPFIWYLINTFAISIIFTVLYLKVTSVIPAMLLHAGLNTLGNYIPFNVGIDTIYPYLSIVNCFMAFVIVAMVIGLNQFIQQNHHSSLTEGK